MKTRKRLAYDIMIMPDQQELISKLLEDYQGYKSLPDKYKEIISEVSYDNLLRSINYNCNINERSLPKKLFVLVDYTNAFTIGSFANKPSQDIDLQVRKRTEEALLDPDTKVVVLIDSHDERYYLEDREGIHLPIIHGHTPFERRIYGETGKLFERYWREDEEDPEYSNYFSEDGKVYFIEKNRFGTLNIDNTINVDIIDAINVVDGLMSHKYLDDSSSAMNGSFRADYLEDELKELSNKLSKIMSSSISDERKDEISSILRERIAHIKDRISKSLNPEKIEYDYNCLYHLLGNLYVGKWEPEEITVCGVATNVCVLSNAVILMTEYPDAEMYIYEDSVASYDEKLHKDALNIMEGLGINIVRNYE